MLVSSLSFAAMAFVVVKTILLFRQRSNLLWPGTKSDPSFAEPLPPGSLGCPFFGNNILAGSSLEGPEYFYRNASSRLGHPSVWKFYFMGTPAASISGASLVKDVLSKEFSVYGSESNKNNKKKKRLTIFGTNNVMFERDKQQHSFLRSLVGSAMSPPALQKALPTIVQIANDCIDDILSSQRTQGNDGTVVRMEDVCTDYTMEIVRKQLLGLNDGQSEQDRILVRQKLQTWLSAMYSVFYSMPLPNIVIRQSKPYRAKRYIEQQLEDKIDTLLRDGPDSSTLSAMVFAVDDDDEDGSHQTTLTREQVIENASVLVLAGTETSASTLTLAMCLLGLHPDVFQKLVDEQEQLLSKYDGGDGDFLSLEILDKECPYLDAVVKETLRLGAVTGGFPRRARETVVLDGKQIPEGWPVFTNIRLTHQLDPVTRLPDDSHMDVYKGFHPERWLDATTRPSDFIPFGAGPRYCLGANLAMLEIKVFLALFSRRVPSFELVGEHVDTRIDWNPRSMIPKPANGVEVKIPAETSDVVAPRPAS